VLILILILWVTAHPAIRPADSPVDSVHLSASELPTGQTIDKVICAADATQSYALYLPSKYTPDKKWPILYAFDPGARGKLPLDRFKEAAERYGWILAGSNNSRNGPMSKSLDAAKALWKDTHERFAIDEQQTYVTGFSGGARVAIFLASACRDCVAGVIACGAGFPPEIKPSPSIHFALFSTAGTEDFNFPELKELGEALTKAGVINHFEVFSGRHEWPSATVTEKAIEWMELQAFKTGARARDENLIDQLWRKQLHQADAAQDLQKIYEAYEAYAGLADTFRNLREVAEVERRANELRSTREVKQAISDERREISRQRELERQINDLIYQRERNSEDTDAGPRLAALLQELRKSAKAEPDSSERRVARRVIEGQFILFFEQGRDLAQQQKRYDEAVKKLVVATELAPDRAGVLVMLASAYALQGDKKKALQSLKTAIDKGLSDRSTITDNHAFDSLRNEPLYLQLLEKIKPGTK
jgi:predicted esterase